MRPAEASAPRGIALETADLGFAYEAGADVLHGVSVRVEPGDFVAVIGQNASGKTTLAKHFNGLLRPSRGRVLVGGRETASRSVGQLAALVGYAFQNPDHQIFSATVRDEVAFGPRNLGHPEAEVERLVGEALARFDLSLLASSQPALLGFGLRRKVGLAAVYAAQPLALVLDEPTAGLDAYSASRLMEILGDLNAEGRTILLITHDLRLVAERVPRCLVLDRGAVIAYGDTRAVFRQRELLEAVGIELPQVPRLAWRLQEHGLPQDLLSVDEFCGAYARAYRSRRGGGGDASGG